MRASTHGTRPARGPPTGTVGPAHPQRPPAGERRHRPDIAPALDRHSQRGPGPLRSRDMADGMFQDYTPFGFCEVLGGGGTRAHYAGLVSRLDALGPGELAARSDLVGTILRRQGI